MPGSRRPFDPQALGTAFARAGWALLLPVIVLGGIYGGVFTPTEAGAVAFAASAVIALFVHRDVPWRELPAILAEAATLIGSLVLIVVLAFGLNDFLAEIDAPGFIRDRVIAAWKSKPNVDGGKVAIVVEDVLKELAFEPLAGLAGDESLVARCHASVAPSVAQTLICRTRSALL